MNTKICVALLSSSCLLAACTTTDQLTVAEPAQTQQLVASASDLARIEEDLEYIERVERIARTRGITVRWINKPYKRVASRE